MITLSDRWRNSQPPGLTRSQAAALEELAKSLGQHVAAYALREYLAESAFPNVLDFLDWAGKVKETLPDDLVCAAYLDGDPSLVAMADDLETLRGAWFPDEQDKERIFAMEQKLRRALI